MQAPSFKPQHFLNRELSWLEFNQRVLDEALDRKIPLLERLKFFCIVSSNLDEFFEVRVAGLKQQIEAKISERTVDGYRGSLFSKLQVQSRTGMVLEAIRRGLVKI